MGDVRKGHAFLVTIVGGAIAMVGASMIESAPIVSSWDLNSSRGTSPGVELGADQPYYLWGDAGCEENGRYPVSIEIVELATGAVVTVVHGELRDSGRGCWVDGNLGELHVPRDGRYAFSWSVGSDLAARGVHFDLKALPMPLAGIGALLIVGVVVAFLSIPLVLLAQPPGAGTSSNRSPRTRRITGQAPPVPRIVGAEAQGAAAAPQPSHEGPKSP